MFCDVIWCYTNEEGAAAVWAALLAFIAALMALAAAAWVGRRQSSIMLEQARIQALQADIANRALEIEDLKVRTDLFDKRMAIFDAAQAFTRFIFTDGAPPNSRRGRSAAERQRQMKVSRDFSEAMERSRFVFDEEVRQALWDDIWIKANQLEFHTLRLEAPQAGDEVDHAQKVLDLQLHFASYDLNAVMGPKLRLY